MERKDFVLHRVAFSGLPYPGLRLAEAGLTNGAGWRDTLVSVAREMRRAGATAGADGHGVTAMQYWRWASAAYHCATLGPDLMALESLRRVGRLRRLSVEAYRRALPWDVNSQAFEISADGVTVSGYARRPVTPPAGAVLLVNGLDSLCEVEMHAFGNGLLARGLAVATLDFPAQFSSRTRRPTLALEKFIPALDEWLSAWLNTRRPPLAVFGVSFGGYFVARLLGLTDRFAAGVAVSPPAWMGAREIAHPYLSRMLRWSFAIEDQAQYEQLAAAIDVGSLPKPHAPCRLYDMDKDALFGQDHAACFQEWGGKCVQKITIAAEHVGTSRFHEWLPGAFDWIVETLNHA